MVEQRISLKLPSIKERSIKDYFKAVNPWDAGSSLEMSFGGQLVQNMDVRTLEALLKRLDSKMSIGDLLKIKGAAQQVEVVDHKEADEVYTTEWARNAAEVTKLLLD